MLKNKSILAWAFYDWANSVFATVVIAGLFPVVFKQYWASDLAADESTFWLGAANSSASLLIVVLAPLLGAIADCAGIRKRMLIIFMTLGVLSTALLYPLESGYWWLALLFYVLGTLGFMGGNIFYDAMLLDVSKGHHVDRVSGFGFAMGYLGGGLLLAFSIFMTQSFVSFGFSASIDAVLFSFLLAALWWWIFTIPLMIWVKESAAISTFGKSHVFSETANTLKTVLRNPQIRLFLFAYWIYIDGVDTIIRMAVDYGLALGFGSDDLILALLITQFVGFPAAIIYTYIGDRIGTKVALLAGIFIYGLITLLGYSMTSVSEFYMLAILIGFVQGGVQALSRSFYARMIPPDRAAEYFGVYNMMGKAAAVLGPLIMGGVTLLTGNHRYAILSICILFVLGFVLLAMVKPPADRQQV